MAINNYKPLMTCFEYQRLSQDDFANQQDFDYLIMQALPCFDIVVQAGKLQLLVKHYLAKIVLPSGISIEILPKLGNLHNTSSSSVHSQSYTDSSLLQNEIAITRRWVKQMLIDIATQNRQKILPVFDLAGDFDIVSNTEVNFKNGHDTKNNHDIKWYTDGQTAWYDWLLRLAQTKISHAQRVLPNQYRTQEHNAPQSKGKLNLKAQLRHNLHRPHYMYTEQTVLKNNDNVVQFLATALFMLQRLGAGSLAVNTLWGKTPLPQAQWRMVYDQIMQDMPYWQSQLNAHQHRVLHHAISWSWWVLSHFTQATGHADESLNGLPVPALLINMNHAFEQWVISRLYVWTKTKLPNSQLIVQPSVDWLALAPHNNHNDDISSHIIQRLVPDAYIQTFNDAISHVIDIKYKKINQVQDISSSDWQQLSTYQQHLGAKKAWLIYPMSLSFNCPIKVTTLLEQGSVGKISLEQSSLEQSRFEMAAIPYDMMKITLIF